MNDINFNLYAAFHDKLTQFQDKPLLITENNRIYYGKDITAESARLANFMTDIGIKVGDRVSVQVEKSPQAMCLYLACLRAGFVFHPLNIAYQAAELEYFLSNAEPTLVICDAANKNKIEPLAKAAGVKHVLTLNADGDGSLITQSRQAAATFNTVNRQADDLAALLYSSGTTGVPKGIMLSHQNLLSNTKTLVEFWGFNEKDCLLHSLPIFHVHGLFVALGCALLSGASMRWLSNFNMSSVLRIMPQCTVMMGVPTYYTRLLEQPDFNVNTASNVRLFISGSAPLLEETFREFHERTGHQILERYGMSETNMNTSNPLEGCRKCGTVGLPLPGVKVRITDTNNSILPQGEIGNLQVKGLNVFKGYWKLPEKTAEDFTQDGFFNTGDKGIIDADGYVSIVGRSKDMVISGGLNIYPKEIELCIDNIEGIKESAVIGIPHSDFGEAVIAVIVLKPNQKLKETIIIDTLKNQLANFKIPKKVEFIDELPRNTMGKVQKNQLRDRFVNALL